MEFADKLSATLVIFGLLGVFYVVIWHPWRTILVLYYIFGSIACFLIAMVVYNIWFG